MIFVIDKLKYDNDKMELISEKCKYNYPGYFLGKNVSYSAKSTKLYKTKKRTLVSDLRKRCINIWQGSDGR